MANEDRELYVGDYIYLYGAICEVVNKEHDCRYPVSRTSAYVYTIHVVCAFQWAFQFLHEEPTHALFSDDRAFKKMKRMSLIDICRMRSQLDEVARRMAGCTSGANEVKSTET